MGGDAVRVRSLERRDHEEWLELWQGYLRFYREPLPDEVTRATFERLCGQEGGVMGLVSVDKADTPRGLAHLVFHPSSWSIGPYCYLEDLFVGREQRGSGAGRALIEATYEEAAARGATRVYWHTQAYNASARSLYDQVGRLTSQVVYER